MDLTSYCSIDNVEGICLPVDIIKKIERNEKIGDSEKIEDKLESIKIDDINKINLIIFNTLHISCNCYSCWNSLHSKRNDP